MSRFESDIARVIIGDIEISTKDQSLTPVAERFFFDNGTQPVASANGTRAEFPFSCPTSNCTWPSYETLGMCSTCADVSSLLGFSCMETEVDWISSLNASGPSGTETTFPTATVCGYFLNATSDSPVLMSGYVVDSEADFSGEALTMRALPLVNLTKQPLYGDGSIMFKNYRNPVFDAIFVNAVDGPDSVYRNETPTALECVLTWCVKTIESKYELARYTEHVSSTFINTTKGPFPWTSTEVFVEGYDEPALMVDYAEGIDLDVTEYPLDSATVPRNISGYGASKETAYNTMAIFEGLLPSFRTVKNVTSREVIRYDLTASGPPTTRNLKVNPWSRPGSIPSHLDRLANALTDAIRAFSVHEEIVEGRAYEEETYVGVRWAWLTLPVALLLFTMVFLVVTICRTAKERDNVGVWKTSAVATLLYGFPDDMQKKIASDTSCHNTPRAKAKEMKVKLVPQKGWRVSDNSFFSTRTSKTQSNQGPPGWL